MMTLVMRLGCDIPLHRLKGSSHNPALEGRLPKLHSQTDNLYVLLDN